LSYCAVPDLSILTRRLGRCSTRCSEPGTPYPIDQSVVVGAGQSLTQRNTAALSHPWPVSPAEQLLELVALGALEVGRLADFFLFDAAHLNTTPVHDPISALVYAGTPQNVDTVVVGGEVLLDEGRCTRIDEEALVEEMQERAVACSIRTGTTRFVKDRRFTPFRDYERLGHRRPLHRELDAEPPSITRTPANDVQVVSLSTSREEVVDARKAG